KHLLFIKYIMDYVEFHPETLPILRLADKEGLLRSQPISCLGLWGPPPSLLETILLLVEYPSVEFYRFPNVNRGILQRKEIASLRSSTSQAPFFMRLLKQRTEITPQTRSQ